jgi:two-component system cell cycle response regulator
MGYKILIIEDSISDSEMVSKQLSMAPIDMTVDAYGTLSAGTDALAKSTPDVILLDLNLPDSHGYSTFQDIKELALKVPIIVISGTDDIDIATHCVREGGQDYLVKGTFDYTVIFRSILYAVERNRIKNHLETLSLQDELTGLLNRRGLYFSGKQLIDTARRIHASAFILYIDIDGMKYINDKLGHSFGDQALRDLAIVLKAIMRSSDVIARHGGDEFVVLGIENKTLGEGYIKRIQEAITEYNFLGCAEMVMT